MDKVKAYLQLTKPRITLLVLTVAIASFYLASPASVKWRSFVVLVIGITMLAAGIFSLNAYLERGLDLLMRRTKNRPLPAKKLLPAEALGFGAILTTAAILFITVLLGWVAGGIALCTFISYVLIYTSLKKLTKYHTVVGALSGATPPLLGWAAARGRLDVDAWILFSILFIWQFPHFLAIQTIHRDDYARAGIKVLPVLDPTGEAAARQAFVTLVLLICVGLAPFLSGMAGRAYLFESFLISTCFLASGLPFVLHRDRKSAQVLLLVSVIYLPLLFGLLALGAGK
jgi:protoheme IX farnesyltransferase